MLESGFLALEVAMGAPVSPGLSEEIKPTAFEALAGDEGTAAASRRT